MFLEVGVAEVCNGIPVCVCVCVSVFFLLEKAVGLKSRQASNERTNEPGGVHVALGWRGRLDDAVHCAFDRVVAPPRQEVAGVDDDGAGDGRCVDERPVWTLDLQAAATVLEEQRWVGRICLVDVRGSPGHATQHNTLTDRPVIRMTARPDLALVPLENILVHLGIMQQPQRIILSIGILIEPSNINPQPQRHRPHDLCMQLGASPEEPLHERGKHLRVGVALARRRPVIRQPGLALAPDLEALLQVRVLRAQRLDVGGVGQVRHLLAALHHVAAVAARRRPRQRVLGGLRAREEAGAQREGARHAGRRDAVVREVDEAGALEAREDGVGGEFALAGSAREKGGEVDELFAVSGGVLV